MKNLYHTLVHKIAHHAELIEMLHIGHLALENAVH